MEPKSNQALQQQGSMPKALVLVLFYLTCFSTEDSNSEIFSVGRKNWWKVIWQVKIETDNSITPAYGNQGIEYSLMTQLYLSHNILLL